MMDLEPHRIIATTPSASLSPALAPSPSPSLSSPLSRTTGPTWHPDVSQDVSEVHTTLLSLRERADLHAAHQTRRNVAEHEAEAHRLRDIAEKCARQLRHDASRLEHSWDRWHTLSQLPARTPRDVDELRTLEAQIPLRLERITTFQQAWTEALLAARDHMEAATALRGR